MVLFRWRLRIASLFAACVKERLPCLPPTRLVSLTVGYRCGAASPDPPVILSISMLRVRFAPSPTGFLHIGSARTFIFNWLYARHNDGTMILRIDDTDIERNTEASLHSIFEGLEWLELGWDEQYRQSERLDLHKKMADTIFRHGFAYR